MVCGCSASYLPSTFERDTHHEAHLLVIGGGITGVTSAYAIARPRLHQVTLLEKHRYAGHGNIVRQRWPALCLQCRNLDASRPPLLKGLKWMLQARCAAAGQPRPSWHKISWFAEFIASPFRKLPKPTPSATARLAIAAREHLFAWAEAEGIDFDLTGAKASCTSTATARALNTPDAKSRNCWPKEAWNAAP
jgi:D-amino-acid dehydrogenase